MTKNIQNDEIQLALETWKISISVQEHFNEICMKIRNFYISLVSALLALIGVIVSQREQAYFSIGGCEISAAIPVILAIILSSILFYFVDRHWYHRLLVGAVMNAGKIEEEFGNKIPGLHLTKSIGDKSPLDVSGCSIRKRFWYAIGRALGSDSRIVKDQKIHSDAKISIFYKSVSTIFFVVLIIVCFNGGVRLPAEPIADENALQQGSLAEFAAPGGGA